jgi:Lar family restriction alleviation protein
MAENKTCPFCGSDSIEVYTHYGESVGIQYGGYYPECTVCGCRLDYYETREKALEAWNRRADDCPHKCSEGYKIWLSQEHKEGDCR